MKHQLLAAAVLASALATSATAQGFVSTDRLGYTGTVSRYTSQADASARRNPIATSQSPQRDLSIYFVDDNAAYNYGIANQAYFATLWYVNGGNNPNNTFHGFMQMSDIEGGTISSQSAYWLDQERTVFTYTAFGAGGLAGCPSGNPTPECSRLWNGEETSAGPGADWGNYYEYGFGLMAVGLAPATWNPTYNVWYSASDPTWLAGWLTGIFENTSSTDPASNGWYSFDYTLNLDSYSIENYPVEFPTEFGALESAAPEPGSIVLLATGLLGIAAVRRKRRN